MKLSIVIFALIISIPLSLVVALVSATLGFIAYWRGVFHDIKLIYTPAPLTEEEQSIWTKHIARMDAQKEHEKNQ